MRWEYNSEMNFRIPAVVLLCVGIAMPAMAKTVRITKADCKALVKHRAVPGAAYTPGVDVRGKRVTAAGGPDSQAYSNLVPDVIEFPIALNPLKGGAARYPLKGGAARFGETSLNVGVVRFDMKSQRATFNGQPLSRGDTQKLSRKCRKILRQSK